MKKYFLSLIALALLLGAALADEVDVGADEASVTQRINLTIPQRVALHLTEDEWILDLNSPPLGDVSTGEGCFLVPKGYSGSLRGRRQRRPGGRAGAHGHLPRHQGP